jgi:Secretion system C-terminal sorting domain
MKKNIFLLLVFFSIAGFSQIKSTPIIALNADMTAQFTLDSSNSKVTLVLTGPSNKWSSIGIGSTTTSSSDDVYVYTKLTSEVIDSSTNTDENWKTISNAVTAGIRKVTLERALTNSDLNDLQMAFDATNSIDIVWSRSGSALATAPNPNRGSATANFSSTLGVDDVVLNDNVLIYPNPTSGELYLKTENNLSKVTIYNQTGSLVKTIIIKESSNDVKLNVSDLPKALYIFELDTDGDKTFKKVILN